MLINPERCLFLKGDLKLLDKKIVELQKTLSMHGAIIGASCKESSEASHDNFPWEQASRDYASTLGMMNEYKHIRRYAKLVSPSSQSEVVEIGNKVTYKDLANGEVDSVRIGSYRIFSEDALSEQASYESPLSQAFLGLRRGETTAEIEIGGVKRTFEIIDIS